jgi:hypothetical protein
MAESHELRVDVTDAAGLGEPVEVALTVHVPDAGALPERPVVCFAKPGGGYSRGYFTVDLPGPAKRAQADWHADRGWIFVSVDHLGVGDSTVIDDAERLDYTTVAAGSQAAETDVLARIAAGTLIDGFPAIADPLRLGIGQSMGGCMTVIQQGRYHCYDGIGVLGYSAVHTTVQLGLGLRLPGGWVPRDVRASSGVTVSPPALASDAAAVFAPPAPPDAPPMMGWGFHYDDVDPKIVRADLDAFPTRNGEVPPWASATLPQSVASWCMAPGAIAPEAAAVVAPVLVAMGERDVIADPRGELRAYQSSPSVDFYVCPRMGHMHNFAGTRELFWRRIETWSTWVRVFKEAQA